MHTAANTASKAKGRVVPWNKGKLIGQKPPLKLKEIWAIRIRLANGLSQPGTRVVQPRHRQQAARVRPGGASRSRCVSGQPCRPTRDCPAEEDPAAGAIRDHRTNAGRGRCLDRGCPPEAGAVPLSQPYVGVASPFDSAVGSFIPGRDRLGLIQRLTALIQCGEPSRL